MTDTSCPVQRDWMWRWLGLALAALISFVLVRIAVLNLFYDTGDLQDPGWLATIAWHNGWRLRGPANFRGSYFEQHVSLIFWITNAISYVVSLPKFDFYAAFIAAIYALYAAGIYRLWQLSDQRVTAGRAAVAVVVALAATFSGVGMVALRLAHHEMAIPALALWFFIAMAQRSYLAASFWFVLCLMVREDAGLHLFLLLALWGAMLLVQRRNAGIEFRAVCGFAVVALAYALVVFVAKHMKFPGGDELIVAYVGDPLWAHITAPFLLERLRYYLLWRSYVWLPMAIIFAWSIISRNWLLPLGTIAAMPWLAFHFVAAKFTPGTLGYYYGFPFWLALAWPLVALRLSQQEGRAVRRWPYALLLLTSLVGWRPEGLVIHPLDANYFHQSPFIYTAALDHRADYQEFVDYFVAHRAEFGVTVLDDALQGLLIDHTDRSNSIEDWRSNTPPDTLIYFVDGPFGWRDIRPLLGSGAFRCLYDVPGTRIRLAARDALRDRLPNFGLFLWVRDSGDLPGPEAERC